MTQLMPVRVLRRRAIARTGMLLALLGCSDAVTHGTAPADPSSIEAVEFMNGERHVIELGGWRDLGYEFVGKLPNDCCTEVALSGAVWTSSDPYTVAVDASGQVRGLSLGGPVTISATKYGMTATTSVTVIPARVVIRPDVPELAVGESIQLIAVALDAQGNERSTGPVDWAIATPGAATLTSTGLLTGVKSGPITVTASLAGATGTTTTGVPGFYDGTWEGRVSAPSSPQLSVRLRVRFNAVVQFDVNNASGVGVFGAGFSALIEGSQFSGVSTDLLLYGRLTGTFDGPATLTGHLDQVTYLCGGDLFTGPGSCTLGPYSFSAAKVR